MITFANRIAVSLYIEVISLNLSKVYGVCNTYRADSGASTGDKDGLSDESARVKHGHGFVVEGAMSRVGSGG